ncbi:hypothetical protein [Dietzia cinnamea]|uniref:Uncharacterized protein n=1 Tax=Dietzia cinnamea TaxID=321318 RepID=A0A4R3ZT13_9ACTN|nr:hypothetical protein [Dietzia cinnamea]TCW23441.1 hypothetical protein EDD19_1121 [Dietzia cinnamea]
MLLALGSMPGVANAQSVEIGIGVSAVVGSVALGAALGSTGDVDSSGGTGSDQLTGSLDNIGGSSEGGSSEGGSLEGGSLGDLTGSLEGGSSEGGSLEGGSLGDLTGSLEGGSDEGAGSLATILGSLTGSLEGGSEGGSLDDVTGSLEGIFESITAGSSNPGSSDNTIDLGSVTDIVGSSGSNSLDAGAILAVGSLAAGSIGLGLAISGGVNLPPLPAINVGAVCNLPQEAIDFLKDNGSMERHECEPEQQLPS